ncbi:MAG: hypothetical protein WCW68_14445 [Methanothrix sp.]
MPKSKRLYAPDTHELSDFGIESKKEIDFDAKTEWEWAKMPEYKNQKIEEYQAIIVHFNSKEDVDKFAKLVNQPITEKTKWINFPDGSRQNLMDFGWVNES